MVENQEKIQASIRQRFARVALSPTGAQRFPLGPESAKELGYSEQEIDSLPGGVTESFAGVGNPFSLGELSPGEVVLDLGCGAGMDCILAARRVGPSGKVIGIDMVDEMLTKARENAASLDMTNIEFRSGTADKLQVPDQSADVVITNGVFNLCVDKPKVASEMFRALRRGGRLQMADILLEEHVTPEELAFKGEWSN